MPKSPDAFRTISEVADWLGIQAHVLRFWESKFTQVKPIKRAGGRRYYRPADMLLLGGIRKLLHDDGLTIKGVQKILREEGMSHVAALSAPLDDAEAEATISAPASKPAPKQSAKPEAAVVLPFEAPKSEPAKPAEIPAGVGDNQGAPQQALPDAPDVDDPATDEGAGTKTAPDAPVADETPDTAETPPVVEADKPASDDGDPVQVATSEEQPTTAPDQPLEEAAQADPHDSDSDIGGEAGTDQTVTASADIENAEPLDSDTAKPDAGQAEPSDRGAAKAGTGGADPSDGPEQSAPTPAAAQEAMSPLPAFLREPAATQNDPVGEGVATDTADASTGNAGNDTAPEAAPEPQDTQTQKQTDDAGKAAMGQSETQQAAADDADPKDHVSPKPSVNAADSPEPAQTPADEAPAPTPEMAETPKTPDATTETPEARQEDSAQGTTDKAAVEATPPAPKARDIGMPAITPESEIHAETAALSSAHRLRHLNAKTAKDIAPLLVQLAALRDRMATRSGGGRAKS